MRDHDDLPHFIIETEERGGFSTFLLGAALSAAAALLLAPRSGAETQRQLREFATRLRDDAEDARETVVGLVDRTRGQVEERLGAVRGELGTRAEQARSAVDAGRRAARDARGELERRVAEAKNAYRSDAVAERTPDVDLVVDEVIVADISVEPDAGDLAR
jgi:gas vesicle protein